MEFTSEMKVELVENVGNDEGVVRAARVSTGSDLLGSSDSSIKGIIGYLMKNRHGSPFEHNSLTFRIEAPIFVFREFMRHRIGWSYNEISGRYTTLEPKFYVNDDERKMVQVGSGAHPSFEQGGKNLTTMVNGSITSSAKKAWKEYESILDMGAAPEVARTVLPVGIYSTMYATCNTRSLMSFLALRVDSELNHFETKPLHEIEQVALLMEKEFARLFPITHTSFEVNGRVSP
jgi:thymidylate synthase (FAD)